jgi:hypothetical protein
MEDRLPDIETARAHIALADTPAAVTELQSASSMMPKPVVRLQDDPFTVNLATNPQFASTVAADLMAAQSLYQHSSYPTRGADTSGLLYNLDQYGYRATLGRMWDEISSRGIGAGWTQGELDRRYSAYGRQLADTGEAPDHAEMQRLIETPYTDRHVFGAGVPFVMGRFGRMFAEAIPKMAERGVEGAAAAGTAGAGVGSLAGGVGAIPGALAFGGQGLRWGAVTGMAEDAAKETYGAVILQLRSQGVDLETAKKNATIAASVSFLANMVFVGKLPVGSRVGSYVSRFGATKAVGQAASTGVAKEATGLTLANLAISSGAMAAAAGTDAASIAVFSRLPVDGGSAVQILKDSAGLIAEASALGGALGGAFELPHIAMNSMRRNLLPVVQEVSQEAASVGRGQYYATLATMPEMDVLNRRDPTVGEATLRQSMPEPLQTAEIDSTNLAKLQAEGFTDEVLFQMNIGPDEISKARFGGTITVDVPLAFSRLTQKQRVSLMAAMRADGESISINDISARNMEREAARPERQAAIEQFRQDHIAWRDSIQKQLVDTGLITPERASAAVDVVYQKIALLGTTSEAGMKFAKSLMDTLGVRMKDTTAEAPKEGTDGAALAQDAGAGETLARPGTTNTGKQINPRWYNSVDDAVGFPAREGSLPIEKGYAYRAVTEAEIASLLEEGYLIPRWDIQGQKKKAQGQTEQKMWSKAPEDGPTLGYNQTKVILRTPIKGFPANERGVVIPAERIEIFRWSEKEGKWTSEAAYQPREILNSTSPQKLVDQLGEISASAEKNIITLFKNKDSQADVHTVTHEFTHAVHKAYNAFANEIESRADRTLAETDMIADLDKLNKWAGLKRGVQPKKGEAGYDAYVKGMEKVAYGFEKYMSSGKAPTQELQGVFEKMGRWIRQLYAKSERLQAELPAEIRGVFDRWIALSDNIDAETMNTGARDAIEAFRKWAAEGVDDPKKVRLSSILAKALEGVEALGKESAAKYMGALVDAFSDSIRATVERDVRQTPRFRALFELNRLDGKGKPKGFSRNGLSPEMAKTLEKAGMLDAKNGVDIADMASRFGIERNELVNVLINGKDFKESIADEFNRQRNAFIAGLNPDRFLTKGRYAAQVLEALHKALRDAGLDSVEKVSEAEAFIRAAKEAGLSDLASVDAYTKIKAALKDARLTTEQALANNAAFISALKKAGIRGVEDVARMTALKNTMRMVARPGEAMRRNIQGDAVKRFRQSLVGEAKSYRKARARTASAMREMIVALSKDDPQAIFLAVQEARIAAEMERMSMDFADAFDNLSRAKDRALAKDPKDGNFAFFEHSALRGLVEYYGFGKSVKGDLPAPPIEAIVAEMRAAIKRELDGMSDEDPALAGRLGEGADLALDFLESVKKPVKEMTAKEFADFRSMLEYFIANGKENAPNKKPNEMVEMWEGLIPALKAQNAGQMGTVQKGVRSWGAFLRSLSGQLRTIGRGETKALNDLRNARRTVENAVKMPFETEISKSLSRRRSAMWDSFQKEMDYDKGLFDFLYGGSLSPAKLAKLAGLAPEALDTPALRRMMDTYGYRLDQEFIEAMMNHAGTEYNRTGFEMQFKWEPGTLLAILDGLTASGKLTEQMWRDTEAVWNYNEKTVLPAVSAMYKKLNHVPMTVETASPFRVGGVDVAGGYFPIHFDGSGINVERMGDDPLGGMTLTAATATRRLNPTASGAMTRKRRGTGGKVFYKGLDAMHNHVRAASAYAAYADYANGALKAVRKQDFKDAYVAAYGLDDYMALKNNLAAMVQDDPQATNWLSRKIEQGANIGMQMTSFLNMGMGLNAVQAFTPAVQEMGLTLADSRVWDATMYHWTHPQESYSLVRDLSPTMALRLHALWGQLTSAEAASGAEHPFLRGYHNKKAEVGNFTLQWPDSLISVPMWEAAFAKKLSDLTGGKVHFSDVANKTTDFSPELMRQSADYADGIILAVNPTLDRTATASMTRGRGFMRLFNVYTVIRSAMAQRTIALAYHQKNKASFRQNIAKLKRDIPGLSGDALKAAEAELAVNERLLTSPDEDSLANHAMMSVVLPAALWAPIAAGLSTDKKDDYKTRMAKTLASQFANQAVLGVFGAEQTVTGMADVLAGRPTFKGKTPLALMPWQAGYDFAMQTARETRNFAMGKPAEVEKDVSAAIEVLSVLTGIPIHRLKRQLETPAN